MEYETRTFAELPSGFRKLVETRDARQVVLPGKTYAFRFFDELIAIVEHEGLIITLRSHHFNFSPWYFRGGQIFSLEELENQKEIFIQSALQKTIREMKSGGYDRVFYADGKQLGYLSPDDIWLD